MVPNMPVTALLDSCTDADVAHLLSALCEGTYEPILQHQTRPNPNSDPLTLTLYSPPPPRRCLCLSEAPKLLKSLDSPGQPGYIILNTTPTQETEGAAGTDTGIGNVSYCEFVPMLFAQHADRPYRQVTMRTCARVYVHAHVHVHAYSHIYAHAYGYLYSDTLIYKSRSDDQISLPPLFSPRLSVSFVRGSSG